jgi:hypothetical protein
VHSALDQVPALLGRLSDSDEGRDASRKREQLRAHPRVMLAGEARRVLDGDGLHALLGQLVLGQGRLGRGLP